MNRIKIVVVGLLIACFGFQSFAVDEKEDDSKDKKESKAKGYAKFKAEGVEKDEGLFTIFKIDDKYYFEINDSLLGRDFLMGARVAELSSTSKVVAGEMRKAPVRIQFSRDDEYIFMRYPVSDYMTEEDDAISVSVKRNSLTPILYSFPIEALNIDSTAAVFEVTKFFSAEIPVISPFNSKYKAGKLETVGTYITKSTSFPENVEIKTQMRYSNSSSSPFLIVMNRSILLLPKTPMKPRLGDDRIGYFSNSKRYFSSEKIGIDSRKYIARFHVAPKPEDIERYKAGELVEPQEPIVFYIDNAYPKEWRKYIKAGVEDWQIAFEAIGFKNAILAKDYPIDDPDFNPEDIRYSCIRYISTPKANSMGPRWIDPRSGEVIGGDVLWWHNVIELLRDWRFVQCGAADPKARKRNPDMEIMGEMIRYVVAHELGHTLGLEHNMRASYAFPVDSLRSATFTQKYGTTPSIMDYARFNYIAQPGDEGIRFTPPALGAYDCLAIKWGYQPTFAKNAEEEKAILNSWLEDKQDDPVYRFGAQSMGIPMDPSSQNEALGDDAIKASTYGVKNAKFIMSHLIEWTQNEGEDYDYLYHIYDQLLKQYDRYIGHVTSYLGGVYIRMGQLDEGESKYTPVSAAKQREALAWLFNELDSQTSWIINDEVERRLGTQKTNLFKSQAATIDKIMSAVVFQRLQIYHTEYKPQMFIDDVHEHVWAKTKRKEKLDAFERHVQASYIHNLLTMSGYNKVNASKSSFASEDALAGPNAAKVQYLDNIVKPILFAKVDETRALLKKHLKDKDPATRAHYIYFYKLLEK